MTSLKALLVKAKPAPVSLIKRTITWKQVNPATDDTEEQSADIFVVPAESLSFAASDRIYSGGIEDRSGRLIVERVRLGENGEEQLTLENLSGVNPALGWALFLAVTDYDKEVSKAREDKKKLEDQDGESSPNE